MAKSRWTNWEDRPETEAETAARKRYLLERAIQESRSFLDYSCRPRTLARMAARAAEGDADSRVDHEGLLIQKAEYEAFLKLAEANLAAGIYEVPEFTWTDVRRFYPTGDPRNEFPRSR